MRMVVVFYTKCILVEALSVIVLHDDGGFRNEEGGSILPEGCISEGL